MDRDTVRRKKLQYPRDERFDDVCKWICNSEPLSEELKRLYRDIFKGEPYQRFLYNTIIWNIPDESYDTFIHAAAELYHYQRCLNKKIGRTYYSESVKDSFLLHHIYREIMYRFKSIKNYDYNDEFEDQVMEIYLEEYAKNASKAKTTQELFQASKDFYTQNTEMSALELLKFMAQITPVAEQSVKEVSYKDYFLECLRRNEPENHPKNSNICKAYHYTKYLEIHSGNWSDNRLPKDKDELYIICIGLALSLQDFEILRAALGKEINDSTKFADNTYTNRDKEIQSVLENIDIWYENARIQYNNPPMELVPQKVLLEVDKMLEELGYSKLYGEKRYKKKK